MRLLGYCGFIWIMLLLIACEKQEAIDPNYPTIIEELSKPELDQLLNQLGKTPLEKYTSIDHFGFPSFRDGTDDSIKTMQKGFDASEAVLAEMSRRAMLDYGTFLNATDSSKLQVRTISTMHNLQYQQFFVKYPDSLPPAWKLTSMPQYYKGYEVRGTSLNFVFTNEGLIALSGQWYHEIFLPDSMLYNEEAAKQSIIGKTLTHGSKKFVPSASSYWYNPKLVILPLRLNKTIELRFCWALYPDSWEVLVDTQTGEKLSELLIGTN